MRSRIAVLALCAVLAACATAPGDGPGNGPGELRTIPALDLPRYEGTWYEIAKFPNRFQKQCLSDTQAVYSAQPDGTVRVLNRCRVAGGAMDEAVGTARQQGGPSSPKLKVRFAPAWLSWLPAVWGDYWVVDLDPDYQLSAVSEPRREYLWVLSRTPRVEPDKYEALLRRLDAQGLDIVRLERTPQGETER
ncbi:lipocalin family protein [Azohydromonas caseinilytica]|uniref:Outer membrane lipoprotein Blc n=1 Tax=Azohydromonas caseinilytica TaxID=2728836 RepID=A0A848FKV6_9BURK|nr:lipocalin family protein [Azohydromonas caseinilytica]NML18900.1 lipocalin family protein [Azohydromonas caseinilytica]